MKQTNLVDFGEIVYHAQSIGYDWNTVHDILVKDILPYPGESSVDWDITDFDESNPYGFAEDTNKVMKSYLEENKITYCTIVR